MPQLWQGRASKAVDSRVNDFNSSIRFDARMIEQDIQGSLVHSAMLGRQGIISQQDVDDIHKGLHSILEDLHSGALEIDPNAEDVHTFVEQTLTACVGDAGKRLHTGRSRNDQVALDIRLNLREASKHIQGQIKELITVLCDQAEKGAGYVMPGYTHLQRAQPVTFGHQLMAYAWMLLRDLGRLQDATARMDAECPLGSGALAGTTYPLDRFYTAEQLGFAAPCGNSIDGVSDRDFCIELCSAMATCMMHLSRLSEEIILWCSWEFKFIELDDAFTTGSSIMPQKKNPDVAELLRGKTGRPVPRLWAAIPMKPRPEIIWRLSDSNMVILRLYDWSKIVLLTDSFVFRKKLLCDPCKNYQPPHRIFVHRWEKLCVRYPTSAKAQIRHERRTTQCPVRTTTS